MNIPEELKDAKVFMKLEKRLQKILKADHGHRSITTWKKCSKCQGSVGKYQEEIRKLGFTSETWMQYKKIMNVIISHKLHEKTFKKTTK